MKSLLRYITLGAAILATGSYLSATLEFTLDYVGSDLVLTLDGTSTAQTLDLSGLGVDTDPGGSSEFPRIFAAGSTFVTGEAGATEEYLSFVADITGPEDFGSGFKFPANFGTGPLIGFSGDGNLVFAEQSLNKDLVIVGGVVQSGGLEIGEKSTAVWTGVGNVSGLGISGGTYEWFLPNGDNVILTAVPEPSTYAALGFGVAGLLAFIYRRRLAAKNALAEEEEA